MNLNAEVNAGDLKKLRPSRKLAVIVAIVTVILGAAWLGWHYVNHPPKPWLVRWKLNRYLASKAGTSDFKVAFPFPSKAEMSKPSPNEKGADEPKGLRTGKTFEALTEDYHSLKLAALRLELKLERTNDATAQAELQKKQQALDPITDDLWELQRKLTGDSVAADGSAVSLTKARVNFVNDVEKKLGSAESYGAMYRGIGQELWVAEKLIESRNIDHRRSGVSIAFAASRAALNSAVDGWVAARIVEGYVLPHLDVANDPNRQSPFNADAMLGTCANVFRQANEMPNAARVYELYLAKATNPQRADWARYQIADAYQQADDPKTALTYLKKIQNTNDTRLQRRIAWLQRQVDRK